MPEQPSAPWPDDLAATIGKRVAYYRGKRGLSAQQLSDALRDVGLDLKRSVIGNLESGYRRTVSVGELIGLARVLRVPPLLLIFPVGVEETMNVLPGRQEVDTWAAAKWFTGEADYFPGDWPEGEPERPWEEPEGDGTTLPARLYREHERLLRLREIRQDQLTSLYREADALVDKDTFIYRVRQLEEERDREDRYIQQHRDQMRLQGVKPPALLPALAHLNTRQPQSFVDSLTPEQRARWRWDAGAMEDARWVAERAQYEGGAVPPPRPQTGGKEADQEN